MAYIRSLKNGSFRADVRMKGIIKNKTFLSMGQAKVWAVRVENHIKTIPILSDEKLTRVKKGLTEVLEDFDNVIAKDPHDLVKVLGLRNSIEALTAVLDYLLHRQESRGSVINSDHPETDNEKWLVLSKSMLKNGKLELWDEPIPHDEFYVNYRPKSGKSMHPFFKVAGRQVESDSEA